MTLVWTRQRSGVYTEAAHELEIRRESLPCVECGRTCRHWALYHGDRRVTIVRTLAAAQRRADTTVREQDARVKEGALSTE